ncbi:MAG: dihydrolipoyl dehydrogenase [Verrucomicrobiota bacterium]|nr:dihydrolipoyl dehydrogenase [Verrucomicrobiota bacterium]
MEKFDVVVIGGGPGGYPAAIRTAQRGASVALVEKESLGGTCLNCGCIPTKTLIASADLFWRIGHAADLGLAVEKAAFNYAAMAERKNSVVSKLRSGAQQLLKWHGVKVFAGAASFATRNRIAVAAPGGAEPVVLETTDTIVATGSDGVMPGFLPKRSRVVGSREFLDLTQLPASLIVLGGGVIGCEFACLAAQLGAKVTVVELLKDILIMLDTEVRRELRRHMEKTLGIRVLTGKPLEKIEAGEGGVGGMFGEEKLEAELLLCAIGRKPVSNGLKLENAGLQATEKGAIEVDEYGRTKVAGVYAVGDCTAGSTHLAHAATAQGTGVADNIVSNARRKLETLAPACIFTSPEIGSVGLTEQKAQEQGVAIEKGKFMFGGLGKAMAAGETSGFVKWIARADTGQLVGAHAVGAHATELIAEATVAIRAELTVEEFGRTIHCHPTFSESWMEAAHAMRGTRAHQPPARRKA